MADECLQDIKSWLDSCHASHKLCHPNRAPFAPTRVLDIGSSDNKIRIHICNGSPMKYAALSYCWGQAVRCSTNRKNLAARLDGFDASILPTTHQDAIHLVRALGLRYLWIDALSIVQDDQADWESESASMGSIYRNAYVTIAAVAASSAGDGFLKPRVYANLEMQFEFSDGEGEATEATIFAHHPPALPASRAIYESGWRSRAWTFQEEMLSTSVLYCTPNAYYFECLTGDELEKKSSSLAKPGPRKQLPWRADFRTSEDKKITTSDLFDGWYELLADYSGRHLSEFRDIFPAASGIAHNFAQHVGDEYIAGLWKSDLVRGLLWRHYPRHAIQATKMPYRAPSWSWASVAGKTSWRAYYQFQKRNSFEILSAEASIVGADDMGRVESGILIVRGRIIPAIAVRQVVLDNETGDSADFDFPLDWMRQNVENPQFFWDHKEGWEDQNFVSHVYAVPIGTRGVGNSEHHFLAGLLLKRMRTYDDDRLSFERCGYFELDVAQHWRVFDNVPVQTFSIL
jgi:hypothetical protein